MFGVSAVSVNRFMEIALMEARIAQKNGEVPIGAVVVCSGAVISASHNLRETNKNALHHAEILAISAACEKLCSWRLENCDLYVTLEPCPMCAGAIMQARIKNVYFGAYDKNTGCFGTVADFSTLQLPHKISVFGGIMEDECTKIIKDFFEELRSIK